MGLGPVKPEAFLSTIGLLQLLYLWFHGEVGPKKLPLQLHQDPDVEIKSRSCSPVGLRRADGDILDTSSREDTVEVRMPRCLVLYECIS